jgi:hypothetical protein
MGIGWRNRPLGQALRRIPSKKRSGDRLIFKIHLFGVDDPERGELDERNA